MKLALWFALLGAPVFAANPTPFRLDPGEFRWIPFTVNQTPTEVESSFQVMRGDPSVHIELLPMSEFRRFNRGREHETLAASDSGRSGAFRRILEARGQYVVVAINKSKSQAAVVMLELRTDLNPNADVIAKTISPQRRLTVILISFGIFFATVTWAGVRLLRSIQS
jgi:hypothetical protein